MRRFLTEKLCLIGEVIALLRETIQCALTPPFYLGRLLEQLIHLGVGSLSITIVIGLVLGLVMTLQYGHGLARFGGTFYVPAIVSVSLLRELAPIFTSLLVAGRVGSGISAELGSMNVTQQVDAIRALGTSPVRVLVVPRVLATVISLPLLSALAALIGIAGGFIIATVEFNMSGGFYLTKVLSTITLVDLLGGVAKCIFFGLTISILACYRGFKTTEGTKGVGSATTWVVVRTSTVILVSDFFLSKLLILLFD